MSVEQNLLFAVLAFEDELIDLQQLTSACRVWAGDKSKPLADLLVERGWVTAEHRRFLEEKAERKLAKHQNDPRVTLNAATRGDVCDALLKEVDDSDVRHSLSAWPSDAPVLIETIGQTLDESQQPKTRYTWVSEVGAGGLGKVWLARDNDLSREVALKEIKPGSASSEAVRRLIKEAQITGQLQHPGIVPVYEVNHEGRPFYTMKLVKGQTLSQAIREHHETKQAGNEDPLAERRLLSIFLGVCDAIAYAHSRGVIHRDLKPDNIVLGEYGEAIVLDWGLARQVSSDDEDSAPIVVTEDGRTDATQAGQKMGTPAYMAPEQASGRVEHMDERTDIYGLGAILFEILSGQPPHRVQKEADPAPSSSGVDGPPLQSPIAAMLHRIATGETPRVHSIDQTIPDELDAICVTAMAKHRDERHQTAKDLKAALLEFQVHEESIELASRADDDLAAARKSGDYDDFSRARFGFETALDQWPENARAADGLSETRRDYSQAAFGRGDFDLALSLLDAADPIQAGLVTTIQAAAEERSSRSARVRRLRRFGVAASLTIAVLASVASVWINSERTKAQAAQQEEATQRGIAQRNEKKAVASREQTEATLARSNYFLAQARWENNRVADARELLQRVPRQHRDVEWHLARRQFEGSNVTLYGHTEPVRSVSFSPDGTRIASGSTDRTIRLWDALTGEELNSLKGHTSYVNSVSFSPDGTRIASGSSDRTIRLWDA
ncbi:MAG: serine/threonine protein kinase, partial [Planctomycetaceae bacterium]